MWSFEWPELCMVQLIAVQGPAWPGGELRELQSSASYCKVLHNLGRGPRIVLAWLIVDGPASTPRPPIRGHQWPHLSNRRPAQSPCDKLRGHKDPEPGPGPSSGLPPPLPQIARN